MSKDPSSRRYLEIPGEKSLIYTFKFDLDLPPPVPQPKTMYIPLDPDRYIKPKLTLFHVNRKPVLMTDLNLSIPVDEVNMRPELYNPAPDMKIELTDKDRELIEEKPKEAPNAKADKKAQPAAGKATTPTGAESNKITKEMEVKKETPGSAKKQPKENKMMSINEHIKQSFEIAKTYKKGFAHPTNEGVKAEEVFEITPDLKNLISEFYVIKTEVSTETLKNQQNLMKFELDNEKKPILAVYSYRSLTDPNKQAGPKRNRDNDDDMDDEVDAEDSSRNQLSAELANDPILKKVDNFDFIGDYVYSHAKPAGTAKKDILFNVDRKEGKAYLYHPNTVILKKKKGIFVAKPTYKEEELEEEKKLQPKKKTIKLLKRDLDKDELNLKKRKYKELHLENTDLYDDVRRDLDNYQEADEDELEELKKKFRKEEEREDDEENLDEDREDRGIDEEDRDVDVDVDADVDVDVDGDRDLDVDVDADRGDVDVDEGEQEYKSKEASERARSDTGEAEYGAEEEEKAPAPEPEPVEPPKPVRKGSDSDDGDAKELGNFFEGSDDDDSDDDDD